MPTSKLWLEHTEKAAWETVQALRDKIAQAERRIERLGPPVAAWQPLLDELDRARGELGLHDESYVEVLRLLLERAAHQRQWVERLERERAAQSPRDRELDRAARAPATVDVTELMRRRGHEPFDDEDDEDDEDGAADEHDERVDRLPGLPGLRGVSQRDLERRRRELLADRALPRDVDALLRSIDAKVVDLGELEGPALSDAALDLGVLALALAALQDEGDR